MWKELLLLTCLSGYCCSGPVGFKKNMSIIAKEDEPMIKEPSTSEEVESDRMPAPMLPQHPSTLMLPSNATSIRADITEGFSCKGKPYGYYADVDNECQIFHVCLPVTYADGRENTFRWSFICPEETIFSQDSFTCMRHEDMNIECEESFKYYELNRNFGMIEEETPQRPTNNDEAVSNKESSIASTSTNDDQDVATSVQQQQFIVEEKLEATTAAPLQFQPSKQKEKPMKPQKPNRRKPQKPAGSMSNKKQSTNTTFRKDSQPLISETELVKPQHTSSSTRQPLYQPASTTTTAAPAVEEVKTAPPRFNKRPAAMSGNLKEKIQTTQPVKAAEPTPIRIELFNQKRKRPTIYNKKDTSTTKPVVEASATVAAIDATEPAPTSHLEFITISTPLSMQKYATKNDKPVMPSKSEVQTKLDTTLPEAEKDTEPQASENAAVLVKPNPEQPLKDISSPVLKEEDSSSSKPSLTEPTNIDKAPEPTPIEVIEEIPAIVEEVLDVTQASATVGSPQTTMKEQDKLPLLSTVDAGEAATTLEELESAKPADAIEIMHATPEMEQQHPMVQEMFDQTKSEAEHLQSMGGFKPVDPVVAAEAEALINDFLSTLMKSENMNNEQNQQTENKEPEKEGEKGTKAEMNEKVSEESNTQEKVDQQKTDTQQPTQQQNQGETAQMTMEKLNNAEKPQQFLHSPQMMMSALQPEMLQIPVQVITTPLEELKKSAMSSSDNKNEMNPNTNNKSPVSIDDVVELVKEQLDQKTTTERAETTVTPKEETLNEEVKKEPAVTSKPTPKATPKPTHKPTPTSTPKPAPLKEETILPIYKRVAELAASKPAKTESKTASSLKTEKKSIATTDSPKKLPQTQARKEQTTTSSSSTSTSPVKVVKKRKVNREKNSRNLKYVLVDPRKRRFLFRSDAS